MPAAAASSPAGRTRPRTVAPPPARRVPTGGLLLLVMLLVAAGVAGGWALGRGADLVRGLWPTPQPPLAADKVAPPQPIDLTGPAQGCPAPSLGLGLATNVVSIDPGQYVTFDATVTNIGRRPCLVDAGDASRQIEILDSAGAVVWTTAHCGGAARELLLGPGDTDQRAIRWNGRVSAPGACGAGQPVLGPGEYTVRIAIAGQPDAVSDSVPLTVVAPPPPPAPEGQETPVEEDLPEVEVPDVLKPDPPVTGDDTPLEPEG